MAQLTFTFDFSRCSGCYACVTACQDQNDFTGNETAFRHVTALETGDYPNAQISYFSISCLHCGDPQCLTVCPVNAIYKDEKNGIVRVERDLCIGCRSCELVCPFGAPKFAHDRLMAKCDMCTLRMKHNLAPACVRACPTEALGIQAADDVSEQKAESASIQILKAAAAGTLGKD